MTFVINEDKKRTWNYGRLWKWGQGKVLFALSAIAAVSLIAMLPRHIHCFLEFWNIDSIPPSAARDKAYFSDFIDMGIFFFQFALLFCADPVLRFRHAPEGSFRSESLVVDDGLLRWVRLSGYSPDGKGYSLVATACRLDACSFRFNEATGMLEISATGEGSMGWMLCDSPTPALTLPFEDFTPAGQAPWPSETELYPYFEPDLVQYLRDQGVEVVS